MHYNGGKLIVSALHIIRWLLLHEKRDLEFSIFEFSKSLLTFSKLVIRVDPKGMCSIESPHSHSYKCNLSLHQALSHVQNLFSISKTCCFAYFSFFDRKRIKL